MATPETPASVPADKQREPGSADPARLVEFTSSVDKLKGDFEALGFPVDTTNIKIEYKSLPEAFDDTVEVNQRLLHPRFYEGINALYLALSITEAKNARQEQASSVGAGLLSLGAYYQPFRHAIVFLYNPTGDEMNVDETAAHELAHLHHDQQRGSIVALIDAHDLTSDQSALRDCLSEGYAEILGAAVVAHHRGQRFRARSSSRLGLWSGSAEPQLMQITYDLGRAVMQDLFVDNGWEAVHAALRDPLSSTEQLLHPIKRGKDMPRDMGPLLELPGAELRRSDTVGELSIYELLLAIGATHQEAYIAAIGWDGDRLLLFRRGEEWVLTWRLLWDRKLDAKQFHAALMNHRPELAETMLLRGRVIDLVYTESASLGGQARLAIKGATPRYSEEMSDARSTSKIEAWVTQAH